MNKVEEQFKDKAIVRGGISMFTKKDALLFVEACRQTHIPILGIDGFFLTDNRTQPSMEDSVDFSSISYIKKSDSIYTDAIEFLKERSDQLFFEIVTEV